VEIEVDVLESGGDCVQRSELEMRRAETDAEDAEHKSRRSKSRSINSTIWTAGEDQW